MQIDIEAARLRQREQPVEPACQNGGILFFSETEREASQPSPGFRDDVDQRGVLGGVVKLGADKRRCLQGDPPRPAVAETTEHAEADLRLAEDEAVYMRPDRRGSIGISRLQRKFEARFHIFGAPIRGRIGTGRGAGGFERTAMMACPRPYLTFVQMGVEICKRRPRLSAVCVKDRCDSRRSGRQYFCKLSSVDDEVHFFQSLTLGGSGRALAQKGCRTL